MSDAGRIQMTLDRRDRLIGWGASVFGPASCCITLAETV
jgi:hypothetical protein